ncbi:hypothetical protein ACN20G_33340 (plasmid) [Streptomyces sp. BI20]|uniref:hypothetical protein n=1 Tax=Streptomyces sp. BI20 TaxID=3403460 RepID=UPI003C74B16A
MGDLAIAVDVDGRQGAVLTDRDLRLAAVVRRLVGTWAQHAQLPADMGDVVRFVASDLVTMVLWQGSRPKIAVRLAEEDWLVVLMVGDGELSDVIAHSTPELPNGTLTVAGSAGGRLRALAGGGYALAVPLPVVSR